MSNAKPDTVTIIIPVYGDWPSLADCIESLKVNVNFKSGHHVMLVNDCGPDVEEIERNITKSIKGHEGFSYFRNEKNLGFVGTCNRAALELDKSTNNILLLNSDTITTSGFLEELISTLGSSPLIGAVSPRSNNATIATVPMASMSTKGIEPGQSYALHQRIKELMPKYSIVPVAHGFCILIRRTCITNYGLFDTIFGKGYGEETDFCLRINKYGYISVLSNWSFVYHMEARSFSLETKNKLLAANNEITWKRYPFYREAIQNYVRNGADIVDRFAHLIVDIQPRKYLVDLRGLENLPVEVRASIHKSILQFRSLTTAHIHYLSSSSLPLELGVQASDTFSDRSIKDTYFATFRPMPYTSIEQLSLINKHSLNLITSLGDVSDSMLANQHTNDNRNILRLILELSDVVVMDKDVRQQCDTLALNVGSEPHTSSNLKDAYKQLSRSIDPIELRRRSKLFDGLISISNVPTRNRFRSAITKNKHIHSLARKAKRFISRT